MVSFQCEGCNDVIKKPGLEKHLRRCCGPVACLDCSVVFRDWDWKSHTSCITEVQKYESGKRTGKFGGPKAKGASQQRNAQTQANPANAKAATIPSASTDLNKADVTPSSTTEQDAPGSSTAESETRSSGKESKKSRKKKSKPAQEDKTESVKASEIALEEPVKSKKEKKRKLKDTESTEAGERQETKEERKIRRRARKERKAGQLDPETK